ncbi:MAG: enoyl-CoA hydratase/isomerase family protein [Bacteroidaceae bacterium]|nr:enoyl-CoA hydratase/isomerase family protein [Bacteroidaceae bacterium]
MFDNSIHLGLDVKGSIAVLRINKPQTLNALSSSLLNEINSVLDVIQDNENIRVIIITGEGKAFVAGADISEMSNMTPLEAKNYAKIGAGVFQRIENLNKVTIAGINGFALGGGCELAIACDIRVASDKAKFGQPEVGLGITPGFSGIRRMMEIVGEAKTKEYIFSGRMFDAQEAERIGLVNKVVPADSLMEECQKIAEEIASKSFNAVITSKKVMNALKDNIDEKVRYQSECFADCFKHKDQKAGMNAFLNKEKPSF